MLLLDALVLLSSIIFAAKFEVTCAFAESALDAPFAAQFLFKLNNVENAKFGEKAAAGEQYLDQPIDHFDSKSATFKQRYFVNKDYANSSAPVHILYLEGANPASSKKLLMSATLMLLMPRNSRLLFGQSTIQNMATLNIQQAIEDIKYFIMAQNKASKETNPKWIVYGAYYAGSLALWFRQKYPKLSVGVVTSSAPAAAAADFYSNIFCKILKRERIKVKDTKKNVEDAYAAYDSACYENIKSSATKVRQMIQYSKGRAKLSHDLKLNPAFKEKYLSQSDFQYFYVVLLTFLQMPVQFNKVNIGPFGNAGGISDVCKIFADSNTDEFGKVTGLVSYIYSLYGVKLADQTKIVPNSYNDLVARLQDVNSFDVVSASDGSPRTFLWQQCNELGYFTTTDFSGLMFGSAIPNK